VPEASAVRTQSKQNLLAIILVVIVVIVLIIAGWFAYSIFIQKPAAQQTSQTPS